MLEEKRFFQVVHEGRAISGVASFLTIKDTDSKYALFLPLESTPSISGTPEAIEIDVTTSPIIGKIEGKTTLEEKEVDFFYHRDAVRRIEKITGTQQEFMAVYPDFTGWKFTGIVSYAPQDATSGDPSRGTLKITPTTSDGHVDNALDLLKKTCLVKSSVPAYVELAVGDTYDLNVQLSDTTGTFASTSETPGVATVADTSDKLTITGVSKGSAVVSIKSSATGQASNETTILVIVE